VKIIKSTEMTIRRRSSWSSMVMMTPCKRASRYGHCKEVEKHQSACHCGRTDRYSMRTSRCREGNPASTPLIGKTYGVHNVCTVLDHKAVNGSIHQGWKLSAYRNVRRRLACLRVEQIMGMKRTSRDTNYCMLLADGSAQTLHSTFSSCSSV
jgi:hypothetical protein